MIHELLAKAQKHIHNSEWQKALAALDEAQQLEPENPDVLYALGKVYLSLGQTDQANTCLVAASKLSAQPQHDPLDYLGRGSTGAGERGKGHDHDEGLPAHLKKHPDHLHHPGDIPVQPDRFDRTEQSIEHEVKGKIKSSQWSQKPRTKTHAPNKSG